MEETVYKVGVIGTGGISRAHSNGYKSVKRTEIIAGADVNEEQLKKYGKEYGIDKFYTDYIEMVETEKPDIVSVCTWVNSHCEIVTRVAKLGIVKGILCEKPMALSMEEAHQMVESCEKAAIKFAIGHQRRHAAQHQKTKELIDSNAIGDLVWLWGSSPPDLLDWGTHVADMMLFYAGEIDWLMGQIGGRSPEQHRRGYYHAHPAQGYMKFKNGARGILETELGKCQIHILGTKGQIIVQMDGGLKISTDESPDLPSNEVKGWISPPLQGSNAFAVEIEDLINCIEKDKEPLDSGKDGRAALEVLLAIYESSRMHTRVTFPMEMKKSPLDAMVEAGVV